MLADFRANLNAESQGRLQVARLYEMTEDRGVKEMLSFLLARDTMHQNQWIAAIKELEEKQGTTVPATVPPEWEATNFSYELMNFSEGEDSKKGRWTSGKTPDGNGEFDYVKQPRAHGGKQELKQHLPMYMERLP